MAPTQAADNGGIQDLLGGLADAASRRYAERYRDDARWDGKYYYDRYDNRRYTRSEWQREIQRRARAEDEGRDWRDSKRRAWEEKKYGRNYRQFNVTPRNSPCVSVGMDSGSAEKLFRPILRLDITFNDGGRCSITNRNSAITSRPESLSPKHVTNFRMKFGTYSQCRNGFERSN